MGPLALVLLFAVLAGPARADVNSITVNPNSPSNAAGARTSYVVTFKVSSTGGLSASASDKITITFPAGTDPTTQLNSQVFDTTVAPNTAIGNCSTSGTVATCGLFSGQSIGGNDAVKVVINGVTNPGAGSQTLKVRTTAAADSLDVTSPPYTIATANPVTNVAVDPTDPTNAAGGRTSYVITFKASATGGMSQAANSRITVSFPAGTDPTIQLNSQVYDTTAAPTTSIGNCSASGTVATCGLFTNQAIAAGDNVKVVINGITSPSAGSKTVDVSTTSDPSAVTSDPYSIVAANPVTGVAVDPTDPTSAAGGRTSYVITFKASATGGMSQAANSRITVSFPSGTDPTIQLNSQVYDTTASATTQIGNCSASGTVMTCGLFTNQAIAAGDNVKVVVNGITSPSAGSKTVDVSTTSDPSAVTSSPYSIVAANPVTGVAVDPTDPTNAAGGRTRYVITFKASATGGMSAAANSRITVSFPSGTDPTIQLNSQVYDTTASATTEIGNCSASGTVVTCGLFTNQAIAAGDNVKVVVNGVTSPSAGSKTVDVSTTSDPSAVTSSPYSIVAANPVTNVSVDPSDPTNAAGGRTSYVLTFKTSATGGMSAAANSKINVTRPAGTDPTSFTTFQVYDTTVAPNTAIGNCSAGGAGVTCGLFTNQAIAAGHNVKVVANAITNPDAGAKTLDVSTTSDPATVTSPSYTIVAAQQITEPVVTPSPRTPAADPASYTITFDVSSTGALNAAASSKIDITFPSGTSLANATNGEVYDATAAPTTQIGNCGFNGQVATCGLFSNQAIAAGHAVRVVVTGLTNPAAGDYNLQAETTSDTGRSSADYAIANQPAVSSISPASGPAAGGTSVTIRGSNFTGATAVGFGATAATSFTVNSATQITATSPAGSGTVDVTVTGPGGTSATSGADLFTYIPRPVVSSISPTSGLTSGGTSVTIRGTTFTGATAVRFGSATAAFTVNSGTQITATSPAGTGVVDVTVTTPSGISATGAADRFTYTAPPPPPPPQTTQTTQAPSESPPPLSEAPTFTSGAPNVTGTRDASLSAVVNPRGLPTTVRFEYGLDPELTGAPLVYDRRTPDQAVGADFTDHSVTANLANLLANATYHVRVVATNSAGTATGADQVFKTKANPPPEPAVLGEEVVGAVVDGLVLVKLPGKAAGRQAGALAKGTGFVPLTQARNLPVGTEVDSRRGTIDIATATAKIGKTQSGEFGGGLFRISQSRDKRRKGLAEMALLNSAFKGAPTYTQCAATGKTRAKKPPKSKVVQLLHANVKGKFRTRGHYAAATVRGTQWDMTDRCDGTLTVVKRGTVVVTDFRRKKDVVVRAGKSYLAKAP